MFAAFVSVLLAPHGFAQPPSAADVTTDPDVTADSDTDWQDRLRDDLEFLTGDDLRGRSSVDETIRVAAEHIADRFRQIGLRTDLIDGGPFQPVSIDVGARPGAADENRLVISGDASRWGDTSRSQDTGSQDTGSENQGSQDTGSGDTEPAPESWAGELGDDFMPMAVGKREAEFRGGLVFAGYGVTADELGYDDYEGLDVEGKAVMVLRKEPGPGDPESPFEGTETTRHAYFATKVANAIAHGAAAVLLVNDSESIDASVRSLESQIEAERRRSERTVKQRNELPDEAERIRQRLTERLEAIESTRRGLAEDIEAARRGLMGVSEAGPRADESTTIPVVSIARDTADRLVTAATGRGLDAIERQIAEQYRPASAALDGVTVEMQVALRPTSAVSDNVLGVLPGKGALADQTVVVGAHYDHVGMGGYGSLAPGTIAIHPGADDNGSGTVTLIAAADRLTRSLATVTDHRRLLFIAFTGEERGLLGSKRYVRDPRFPLESTVAMVNMDMVGRLRDNELTVYGTGTADGLESLVDQVNEEVGFDLYKVATGYGPSDHQSFYEAGIPVLFFFTGLHADYHRPSDKFEKIDFGGINRITDMVCGATMRLATRTDPPAYAETDRRFRIRRQMTAFMGVTLADRGEDVVISGTVPDGPADRSGVREGDLLRRLGDRRIGRSSDVLETLRERSPGDTVNVVVEREGRRTELPIELGKRP